MQVPGAVDNLTGLPCFGTAAFCFYLSLNLNLLSSSDLKLSAMDVSVRTTMKSAVKCNMCCDLQNSGNQQFLECILRFWVTSESKLASVSEVPDTCRRAVCPLCAKPAVVWRIKNLCMHVEAA